MSDLDYLPQLERIKKALEIASQATITRERIASRDLNAIDGLKEPAYLQLINEIEAYLESKTST